MLICVALIAALGLIPPLLVKQTIDVALPRGDQGLLTWLALGMIAAPLAAGLIGVLQNYLNTIIGQRIMFDLRNQLYLHLQRLSLRFYTRTKTGEMMSRLTSDVAGVQSAITGTLLSIVTNVFTIASTLFIIFSLDWRLSLVSLAILPLFIIPTRRVGRLRRNLVKQTQEKNADLTSFMQETLNIGGYILVRIFGRDKDEARRFQRKNRDLMDLQVRQSMVGRWFFMFLGLFGAIGPALIYWFGGSLVVSGALTIGTVVAFTAYLGRLYGPVSSLAGVYSDVMASLAYFERVFQYLDLPLEVAEKPDAKVLPPSQGKLSFEHVTFSYVDGRTALDDVSFTVEPGHLAALVGPSGAGKTTTTYLVPRFYDPHAGAIRLDDSDIRDATLDSLADQIGMVTQETYLFHTSIKENLLYGKPDATEEEIVAAAKAANIHDFIAGLPDGYDTVVGERGYRLSGGEKQRVAIARVLLKNPRLLILDEATSSLDSASEALIQTALEPLMQGRTSLVIAHRLSTILAADLILVMEHGKIVERGTHAELLAAGGLYARLYEQQFKPQTQRPAPGAAGAAGAPAANGHGPDENGWVAELADSAR